jgi:soluble lytic murein transglycosylase-like protein
MRVPREKTINELITEKANKYGVSEEVMHAVIKCESTYNKNAIGDQGNSYGLVQIHLPSWKNITKEQALDPEFAISFLAEKLSEGKGNLWTCYRKYRR